MSYQGKAKLHKSAAFGQYLPSVYSEPDTETAK